MYKITLTLILISFAFLLHAQTKTLPRLQVSDNKRFIVMSDGKPFFWMADTAWELFHRCDKEEADRYLQKRAEQGFNVIQAVALAELDGLETPNSNGDKPLIDNDPTRPNGKYFQHVDYIINRAAQLNIYIALLPTWGDKLFKHNWGKGPEIFNPQNARIFGKWIGNRYKEKTNIIWVLGGDRNPREGSQDVEVWRQMADGIAEGAGGHNMAFMTFHPQPAEPGGSSNWFHQDNWLDLNMHQTGHCPNQPTYKKIGHDYNLQPTKPTLDGEPLYEDHPNCFNAKDLGHSVPEDIRRIMYWDVFAGACGQTYGCHDVWQMYKIGRDPINAPLRPWEKALDLPMANQVKHLKNLMLSRPYLTRIPDQSLVTAKQNDDENYVIATRDSKGTYAFIYFPTGKSVELNLNKLNGNKLKATWYDPRTGVYFNEKNVPKSASYKPMPPSSGKGQDWVLVIDAGNTKTTK